MAPTKKWALHALHLAAGHRSARKAIWTGVRTAVGAAHPFRGRLHPPLHRRGTRHHGGKAVASTHLRVTRPPPPSTVGSPTPGSALAAELALSVAKKVDMDWRWPGGGGHPAAGHRHGPVPVAGRRSALTLHRCEALMVAVWQTSFHRRRAGARRGAALTLRRSTSGPGSCSTSSSSTSRERDVPAGTRYVKEFFFTTSIDCLFPTSTRTPSPTSSLGQGLHGPGPSGSTSPPAR